MIKIHKPTYLDTVKRDWENADSDSYCVTIPGRGQEFIFNESEEFYQWFKNALLPQMHK